MLVGCAYFIFSINLICELVHSGSQPALHVIVTVVKTITPR